MSRRKKNIREFIKLVVDNPELEVITMVDEEIVASDEHSRWISEMGKSRVDYMYSDGRVIYFRNTDEDNVIQDYIDDNYDDYLGIYIDDFASKSRRRNLDSLKRDASELPTTLKGSGFLAQ